MQLCRRQELHFSPSDSLCLIHHLPACRESSHQDCKWLRSFESWVKYEIGCKHIPVKIHCEHSLGKHLENQVSFHT